MVWDTLNRLETITNPSAEDIKEMVIPALKHENWMVRQIALEIVGKHNSDGQYTPYIETVAQSDDHPNLRRAARGYLPQLKINANVGGLEIDCNLKYGNNTIYGSHTSIHRAYDQLLSGRAVELRVYRSYSYDPPTKHTLNPEPGTNLELICNVGFNRARKSVIP